MNNRTTSARVGLYRLVRRSYRIVEETQNGVTRFIPEHRCILWPFWNPDEFSTSEYTTSRVSFPTLDKAMEAIAKEQSRDVVTRKIHSANAPVTDAEPSTPANTRAQGPRSV